MTDHSLILSFLFSLLCEDLLILLHFVQNQHAHLTQPISQSVASRRFFLGPRMFTSHSHGGVSHRLVMLWFTTWCGGGLMVVWLAWSGDRRHGGGFGACLICFWLGLGNGLGCFGTWILSCRFLFGHLDPLLLFL